MINKPRIEIRRTMDALRARRSLMNQARVLRNNGIAYRDLIPKAKAASAQVRYLKAEYPALVAEARAMMGKEAFWRRQWSVPLYNACHAI